jgi:hypothetical protein
VVALAIGALGLSPSPALAGGRLIETGHDAEWRCAVSGSECHFIQAAVRYVRNGAPDPSKPVLVLDAGDFQMRTSVSAALGSGNVVTMVPLSQQFKTAVLSTSLYSAIVVASDMTCGQDVMGTALEVGHGPANQSTSYCDLNRPPGFSGTVTPPTPTSPPVNLSDPMNSDAGAINARAPDIKAFFDSGGGLFVGSGGDNGDGHHGDLYYQFIDISGCPPDSGIECTGSQGVFALTAEGRAIGFTDGSNGTPDDIDCGAGGEGCSTHNSFLPPRAGSSLLVAETGQTGRVNTLFEDAQAPNTLITSGPGTPLATAGPPLPIPAIGSSDASISFGASEDTTTFTCQFDGGPAIGCSSPRTFSGLAKGVHRFTVLTTDAAHNQDATPAEISWLVASDKDRDGYLDINPFGAADCDENNAGIHPGAAEKAGNRVDENCDGKIAPFARISASVPFAWERCPGCVRFTRLGVVDVPRGATVKIRCRGRRCHVNRTVGRAKHDVAHFNLLRYVRNKRLRNGTVIEVSITRAHTIGRLRRFRVRPKHHRLGIGDAILCLNPGSRKARRSCPSVR